jgi:1-acyl-sn-glycerol-3-phosphate acyltransferase
MAALPAAPAQPGLAARATGTLIVAFARALTGARAVWEQVPEAAPTVYFANHRSHADFVLVWATLGGALRRRTRPVAGSDYWLASRGRRFVAGDVFRALMIDRTAKQRDVDPIGAMAEVLAGGESLILFPEGTRNMTDDAPLLPFKSGLYHLARRCPAARLVPVWIDNLGRVLPKGAFVPLPLACTVHFGTPLDPALTAGDDKDAFLAAARQRLLDLRPAHDQDTAGAAGAAA